MLTPPPTPDYPPLSLVGKWKPADRDLLSEHQRKSLR
jgi:hypothetical protein